MKAMLHLLCMAWAKEAVITQNHSGYSILLKGIDRKILSVTARPVRLQEFIDAENFLSLWAKHHALFEKEPPEVAIVYDEMSPGADAIAHSIPIELSHPVKHPEGWMFRLKYREQKIPIGRYHGASLFIDWIPTLDCPEPIKALFSEIANYYRLKGKN